MNKVQLLEDRAIIMISGADCFSFLQGLITNDINKIQNNEHELLYALMLTSQGKFLYDFFLRNKDDGVWVDHDATFTQEILKKLSFYKLRSQVAISLSDCKVVFSENRLENTASFSDPRSSKLGFRGYVSDSYLAQVDLYEGVYESLIYENVIPEPHQDMEQNKSFPIEFAMDKYNAISFTKGCYLGQENTSRTKYRGTVRKKMYRFIADRDIVGVETGKEILAGGIKVGTYCSSFGKVGKALMRIEELERCGTNDLTLGSYKITITPSS